MNCRRALWRRHAQSLPACGLAACLALAAALAACGRGEDPNAMAAPLKVLQTHESEGARLDLSLERESLTTAGSVLLRLEVECAESDTVDFPGPDDSFGEFAVVRDEELSGRLVGNRRVVRGHDYVLQPFLPGEYEVPALTVALNGSAEIATEPFAIAVASVLEDPESADLLEIADAIDMPAPWWWWVSLALGAAAILGGAAWWWKRRKEQRLAPLPVPVHEAALAALDALLAEDLPAAGRLKPFYMRLSDVVRRYIEERFGFRAPEQTTEEFLTAMAGTAQIRKDHQQLLRRFLQQADMVKFAEFLPGREATGGAVEAARRFIQQTIPNEPVLGQDRRSTG